MNSIDVDNFHCISHPPAQQLFNWGNPQQSTWPNFTDQQQQFYDPVVGSTNTMSIGQTTSSRDGGTNRNVSRLTRLVQHNLNLLNFAFIIIMMN